MDADDTENVHSINETVEDEIMKDTKKFLDIHVFMKRRFRI